MLGVYNRVQTKTKFKMSYSKKTPRTPDVVDQWLESHGYYRKHTARDSTCLFRVVSEQIFLTQKYHEQVRAECVNYMREHKYLFEKDIGGSVEDYLEAMSGLNEFGGHLEIIAMSKLYYRDIYIFENTSEPENVTNFGYSAKILMYHVDRHYDSVFDKTYIQDAAFCQSLVYNILYKSVFKLPDVDYAVSKMLHEPIASSGNKSHVDYLPVHNIDKTKKYTICDEDWFSMQEDADPIGTSCILEDVSKCMFHNIDMNKNVHSPCDSECSNNLNEKDADNKNKKSKIGLTRNKLIFLKNASDNLGHNYVNGLEVADKNNNKNENNYTSMIPEFVARLLNLTDFHAADPSISCVKQMLKENLTPFPYKVAKALDPEIYRNIEFDTWNEIRREMRYGNWYNGGSNLQVGVKCLVKLSEGQLTWYHCHIQEMPPSGEPCLVFVEELGEKKTVPRDFLQPLPSGQAKPWALPYRHYRNLASTIQNSKLFAFAEYNSKMKKSRICKSRKLKDINSNTCKDDVQQSYMNRENSEQYENGSSLPEVSNDGMDFQKYNELHGLTTFQCNENNVDIIAMPVSLILDNVPAQNINSENESSSTQGNISVNDASPNINIQPYSYAYNSPYMWPINQGNQHNINLQYSNMYQSVPSCVPSTDHDSNSIFLNSQTSQEHVSNIHNAENVISTFTHPCAHSLSHTVAKEMNNMQYPVNYYAPKSILPSGADLPFNDSSTLRFFYNLGIDYFSTFYTNQQANKEPGSNQNSSNTQGDVVSSIVENGQEQLCLDFHNNVVIDNATKYERGANNSLTESKRMKGKHYSSQRYGGQLNSPETKNQTIRNDCNGPAVSHVGSGLQNTDVQPTSSPYVMAFTQVPGMYSTMVPCYPIEEGGNLYIAQYMGMPFGVVPPNFDPPISDRPMEQTLSPSNYSVATSQSTFQTSSHPSSFQNQPAAGPGYYQNQIWYPPPQATAVQPIVIPQGLPYNHITPYQSSISSDNSTVTK